MKRLVRCRLKTNLRNLDLIGDVLSRDVTGRSHSETSSIHVLHRRYLTCWVAPALCAFFCNLASAVPAKFKLANLEGYSLGGVEIGKPLTKLQCKTFTIMPGKWQCAYCRSYVWQENVWQPFIKCRLPILREELGRSVTRSKHSVQLSATEGSGGQFTEWFQERVRFSF